MQPRSGGFFVCEGCAGALLEWDELVTRYLGDDAARFRNVLRGDGIPSGPLCSCCGEHRLSEVVHQPTGVRLDLCGGCRAIFFDRGELKATFAPIRTPTNARTTEEPAGPSVAERTVMGVSDGGLWSALAELVGCFFSPN